jgi:hypothetical protein
VLTGTSDQIEKALPYAIKELGLYDEPRREDEIGGGGFTYISCLTMDSYPETIIFVEKCAPT